MRSANPPVSAPGLESSCTVDMGHTEPEKLERRKKKRKEKKLKQTLMPEKAENKGGNEADEEEKPQDGENEKKK